MTRPAQEPRVKICGITDRAALDACIAAGVAYIGLVFFDRSPRNLDLPEARDLAGSVPPGIAKVALTVDITDRALDALVDTVPIDMLQLHGQETPERVAEIKARAGLPVIKAIGIAGQGDLPALQSHGAVADMLLVDAKPAKGAALPGGNGLRFDWQLIAGRRWPVPWMLAGGLTPDNVAEAIRLTGASQVDVSSGVETAPGVKDPALIARFARAARAETV